MLSVLRVSSCLWIQRVQEEIGREEDLRFNLRTGWKANTNVKNEKIVSNDK